jgi:hypothetical protein
MSCDAAVHAMLFPSRDGKERSVTASLQVCACTMSAPSGDLCLHCGCHGIVVDHNLECEKDACGLNTLLLHCAACNVSFHEECMELLNWGLSRFDEANVKNANRTPTTRQRQALPWCSECFDEWIDDGTHSSNLPAKSEVKIGYTLTERGSTPTPSSMPQVKTPVGRTLKLHTRHIMDRTLTVPLRVCVKGPKCRNECGLISSIVRQSLREEYTSIRCEKAKVLCYLSLSSLVLAISKLDFFESYARKIKFVLSCYTLFLLS